MNDNKRVVCQCCRRMLVPLADGTSRNHRSPGSHEAWSTCQGSGYRLARWDVGQQLHHHSGSVWEVVEDRDRSSRWGDYLIRCVHGTRSFNDPNKWLEEPGKTMVAHGEYLHRHGWTPVAVSAESVAA